MTESNSRITSNSRFSHIDVAKGLGILLTVIGHTLVFSGFVGTKAFATIYAFHMPFFFFLSGYLHKRKEPNVYLSGKVKNLLFPVLLYESINILLYFITWCLRRTEYYERIKFGGFWFILTLLFITVMFYVVETILERIHKDYKKIFISLLIGILFLIIGLIYSKSISDQPNQPIATAFIGYFFYTFGYTYNKSTNLLRRKNVNWVMRIIALLVGFGLLVLLYVTSKMNSCTVDMNTSRYGKLLIFVLHALMGIIGLYLISWAIQKNRVFQFFGRNSLVILLIHIPVSKTLPAICRVFALPSSLILIINTVFSIAISAFAVWLFNKYVPIMAGRFNWETLSDKTKLEK